MHSQLDLDLVMITTITPIVSPIPVSEVTVLVRPLVDPRQFRPQEVWLPGWECPFQAVEMATPRPDPGLPLPLSLHLLVIRNVRGLMRVCATIAAYDVRALILAVPMNREGSADSKRIKLDRERGRRPREAGNRMLAGAMKAANDKPE